MTDEELMKGLVEMAGALEDDSFESIHIAADDATQTWHIRIGTRAYFASSIRGAIREAIAAELKPKPLTMEDF